MKITDNELHGRRQPGQADLHDDDTAAPGGAGKLAPVGSPTVPTPGCRTATTTSAPTTRAPTAATRSRGSIDVKTTATDTSRDDLPRQRAPRAHDGGMPVSPRPIPDERGITLIELLVGMVIGIVVLGGIVTLVTPTAKSSGRVSERVAADQVARPDVPADDERAALDLRLPGRRADPGGQHRRRDHVPPADGQRRDGDARSSGSSPWTRRPEPDRHAPTPATGGAAPTWTFSSTPSVESTSCSRTSSQIGIDADLQLLRVQQRADLGDAAAGSAVSAANAAKTVQVDVNLAVSPATSAHVVGARAPGRADRLGTDALLAEQRGHESGGSAMHMIGARSRRLRAGPPPRTASRWRPRCSRCSSSRWRWRRRSPRSTATSS